jgi:hypothetical protein
MQKLSKTSDLRQPIEKINRKLTDVQRLVDAAPTTESPTFTTSVTGSTSMDVFNTDSTTVNAFGAATTLNVGGTPTTAVTHNYSANATASSTTKTVNLATGGATGSTTNVNIGSANGGTTTVNSPTLAATTVTATNANPTNLTVGGGATVTKFITATTTVDLPSLNNTQGHIVSNISMPGVAVGDPVFVGLSSVSAVGWHFFPIVTATDTVAVQIVNNTGGTLNPASGTLRINCIKF